MIIPVRWSPQLQRSQSHRTMLSLDCFPSRIVPSHCVTRYYSASDHCVQINRVQKLCSSWRLPVLSVIALVKREEFKTICGEPDRTLQAQFQPTNEVRACSVDLMVLEKNLLYLWWFSVARCTAARIAWRGRLWLKNILLSVETKSR